MVRKTLCRGAQGCARATSRDSPLFSRRAKAELREESWIREKPHNLDHRLGVELAVTQSFRLELGFVFWIVSSGYGKY